MSNTSPPSRSSDSSSCCSGSGSSPCGPCAPTTETTVPSTDDLDSTLAALRATASDYSGELSSRDLTIHPDQRGNVRETFRTSWFPEVPPIRQLVRSESGPNVLRGMHLHRKQWDIWHFVEGDAVVRLLTADGSEQFVYADSTKTLAIPPGVAHGFYTEYGCVLMYALTEEYDGTDEFGFYPFDGLSDDGHPGWPRTHHGITVSERDLRATRLEDFDW